MLGLQKVEHLASNVGMTVGELHLLAESPDFYIRKFTVWPPDKKPRDVIAVRGDLRTFQKRLYERVLLPKLKPSQFSHGGVKNRHIASNARAHLGQRFGYKTDISKFFPSVSTSRVNRVFMRNLRCSYIVARYLTRLCTHDFHLALGLITSPILAEAAMALVDERIGNYCAHRSLVYSRFVDDITISGPGDLSQSDVPDAVGSILTSLGYSENLKKRQFGRFQDGFTVTGVRLLRGHLDVSSEWYLELEQSIENHHAISIGGAFDGTLMTESQMLGKIHFASWINPHRRQPLLRRFGGIDWNRVMYHALSRGLMREVTKMTARGAERPSPHVSLPLAMGAEAYAKFVESHPELIGTAPF